MDPNTTPNTNDIPEVPQVQPAAHHTGPIIGAAIVLIILIVGGLYVWSTNSQQSMMQDTMMQDEPLDLTTNQDEPAAIQDSIDSFNLDEFEAGLDADLKALENAL